MLTIILMSALFATTFSFNKLLLTQISPLLLVGISSIIGACILSAHVLYKGTYSRTYTTSMLKQLLPIGLCIGFAPNILRFYGLTYLSSFYASFFASFDPFITALLCYFIRAEKLTLRQIAGIALALIGTLPVFFVSTQTALNASLWSMVIPTLAVFFAIAINRYGWILADQVLKTNTFNGTELTALNLLIGGSLALVTSFCFESSSTIHFTPKVLGMIGYVSLISNVLCARMYVVFLKRYSVTFLSLTEFLAPPFVTLYSWLFLHEYITWHFLASFISAAIGIGLFYGDQIKKKSV